MMRNSVQSLLVHNETPVRVCLDVREKVNTSDIQIVRYIKEVDGMLSGSAREPGSLSETIILHHIGRFEYDPWVKSWRY